MRVRSHPERAARDPDHVAGAIVSRASTALPFVRPQQRCHGIPTTFNNRLIPGLNCQREQFDYSGFIFHHSTRILDEWRTIAFHSPLSVQFNCILTLKRNWSVLLPYIMLLFGLRGFVPAANGKCAPASVPKSQAVQYLQLAAGVERDAQAIRQQQNLIEFCRGQLSFHAEAILQGPRQPFVRGL
jgi:hypothetical protein